MTSEERAPAGRAEASAPEPGPIGYGEPPVAGVTDQEHEAPARAGRDRAARYDGLTAGQAQAGYEAGLDAESDAGRSGEPMAAGGPETQAE
jgi:hypothetical protein